jgi:uncharacterized membrane protein YoaT (DUF817 family)
MKIEKRLRDFLHLKRTKHNCMFGTVQMSCAYNCICRGEAHIQLYVQLICTVPNIQLFLVLLRCKKSRNLFSIKIMKIEKRLRDFLHLKRTKHNCMFGTVQMSCTYNCICRGEAHIQLYVQLICTVPNIQLFLVLLRCKKSRNLFSIFIIFST